MDITTATSFNETTGAAGTESLPVLSHMLQHGLFCKGGIVSTVGFGLGVEFLPTLLLFMFGQLTVILTTPTLLFYLFYWPSNITYESWLKKTNPKYPSVEKVRDEIIVMIKCLSAATITPALSMWFSHQGTNRAFCGVHEDYGVLYNVVSFVAILVGQDVWVFVLHLLGHGMNWHTHRTHHKFPNPTPFSIISEAYIDQFMQSLPLTVFPLVAPVNLDLLFLVYAVFFLLYGCYLHLGFEFDCLSAHSRIINTSYQHATHHAKSIAGKPFYCGYFFNFYDKIFGLTLPGDGVAGEACGCCKCQIAQGKRTTEAFRKIEIPEYEKLLQFTFWFPSVNVKNAGNGAGSGGGQKRVAVPRKAK